MVIYVVPMFIGFLGMASMFYDQTLLHTEHNSEFCSASFFIGQSLNINLLAFITSYWVRV